MCSARSFMLYKPHHLPLKLISTTYLLTLCATPTYFPLLLLHEYTKRLLPTISCIFCFLYAWVAFSQVSCMISSFIAFRCTKCHLVRKLWPSTPHAIVTATNTIPTFPFLLFRAFQRPDRRNTSNYLFIGYLFPNYNVNAMRTETLFCILLYHSFLEQCLTQSRCSINIG